MVWIKLNLIDKLDVLPGDATKAARTSKSRPTIPLEQLAAEMMDADIARLKSR